MSGKQYELTDGSVWTAHQIAEATGHPLNLIYRRLAQSRDKDRVFKEKRTQTISDNTLKIIKSKPFYCEMFRLAMKKI